MLLIQIILRNWIRFQWKYQPLPTNRKRRSRLYHVTTSKVLKKSGRNFDGIGHVNIDYGKKIQLQQVLERKNLLN